MIAPDLHPEDLIERDERGLLTASERGRLDAHLRQCAACRWERMARSDFQHEAELAGRGVDVRDLVAGLLAPAIERKRPRSPRASGLGRVLVGVAITLVAGLVAAAVRLPSRRPRERPIPVAGAPAPSWRHGELAAAISPLPPTPSPAVDRDAVRSSTWNPPSQRERTPIGPQPPATATSRPEPSSASLLFESAAAARRSGDHSTAADLYGALIREYPESPEARTALAIFGRMLLDDGDDGAAVVRFDQYLQQKEKGVLEQDALVGRALALERLGRTADACRTWSTLLHSFPGSAYVDRARSHLANLEAPSHLASLEKR